MFEFSAEDITSDYEFLLRLMNTFIIDTEELYPVRYKVNDGKTFTNLVYTNIILCLLIIMYVTDWLV